MSLLQLELVIRRGGRGGGRGGGYDIALSNLMTLCSLKSSDSVYCSLYCAFVQFSRVLCYAKAKTCTLVLLLQFGNMQFSWHGR